MVRSVSGRVGKQGSLWLFFHENRFLKMEGNLRIATEAVTAKPAYRHHRAKLFVIKAAGIGALACHLFQEFLLKDVHKRRSGGQVV